MINLDVSPLWISLKIAIIATIITFFLGIIVARWMLNYRGKLRGLIDSILIAPLVLPPTVVGFLLLLLLGRNSPVGQLLHQLGINVIFTWQAAVITASVVAFPLMYRTTLASFEQIEPNLLQAARTLGASEWRIFLQVTLPLSYRGIVAATILSFARALGEFGATLMLAGNIPSKTQTIPIAIFSAVESGEMGQAFFWVLTMLVISLSVIITVNFWSDKKRNIAQSSPPLSRRNSPQPPAPPLSRGVGGDLPSSGLSVNISKKLSNFTLAIQLEADQEALGLLGISGSGKSLTLRCIAGLDTPDEGEIILNGKVLFDAKRKINIPSCQRRIGFVFQNYALFPHLSVRENIAFGLKKLPHLIQKQRVNQYIIQMQLQGLENRYPHQLSGGQQQRVAIARALAIEPDALLLDEPFSALDTQLRSQLEKQLIETLATYSGVTLFVSHNLEEIYRICQNLLLISEGKILIYGDKHNIFSHPGTYEVARLTGCKNFSQARVVSPHQIEALDWNCVLTINEPIPQALTYIGIRAHHVQFEELEALKIKIKKTEPSCPFLDSKESYVLLETIPCQSLQLQEKLSTNSFPCWLVQSSETPHRMTLYLKFHHPPSHFHDYHLQVELFKENWQLLKQFPFPWHIILDSKRLLLLDDYII